MKSNTVVIYIYTSIVIVIVVINLIIRVNSIMAIVYFHGLVCKCLALPIVTIDVIFCYIYNNIV